MSPIQVSRNARVRSQPRPVPVTHNYNARPRDSFRTENQDRILGEWVGWNAVSVKISGLNQDVTVKTLFRSFSKHGELDLIDIFPDSRSRSSFMARLIFRPPPSSAFWNQKPYHIFMDDGSRLPVNITLEPRRDHPDIPSLVRPAKKYPPQTKVPLNSLGVGTRVAEDEFLILRTVQTHKRELVVNLNRRRFEIFFQLVFPQSSRQPPVTLSYVMQLPFNQIDEIYQRQDSDTLTSLIIIPENPCLCYRKILDPNLTFNESNTRWSSIDTWRRETDITINFDELNLPVNLKKNSFINLGRWTVSQLQFVTAGSAGANSFSRLKELLADFDLSIQEANNVKITRNPTAPTVWSWIDPPSQRNAAASSSFNSLFDDDYVHLTFPVRYQLEVCISQNNLNEYTLTQEFAQKLFSLPEAKAVNLLEYIANHNMVFYNPMKIFEETSLRVSHLPRREVLNHTCYMRTCQITPTTIYLTTPSADTSNRVIRRYNEYADRFLRVRFTDEKKEGRLNAAVDKYTMDNVFKRVKRALIQGIQIGDRHYEFLAFGNSQFREHGAYFFAGVPHLKASQIRAWMGKMYDKDRYVVSRYAARLGQCFSTTRAVTQTPVKIVKIDDIERNGFTFSDGVGRISRFLAQMITTGFEIETPHGGPPSVFQFRLGGCKGILALSHEAQRDEVHIRPSQTKFDAPNNLLEIIRHSSYCTATLNRQLVIVLSTLGVSDNAFLGLLEKNLSELNKAMTDETVAVSLLSKYVDPNNMTLALVHMVNDDFLKAKDPFVMALMSLWRAWHIKYLKEKARINVDEGACLFGCVDETATLRGYYAEIPDESLPESEKVKYLPQVFCQVFDPPNNEYTVLTGVCILARNPSLHPGDIRVVEAVDVPALNYMKDVIVLPQTGDRDVGNLCSGGDLDGDDYVIIWDKSLIPPSQSWFEKPMDFTPDPPVKFERDVNVLDIINFFVQYMKNDRLGQIANAHLVHADFSDRGVHDSKCIKLAQLHSSAVDYPKNGNPAVMTQDLRPRRWPHFMEKPNASKNYKSKKILGQLYDKVERVVFAPMLETSFDTRILESGIKYTEEHVRHATELKADYDTEMLRVLRQHEIETEFEVYSTFVLSHNQLSKDYKFHEEMGEISHALRESYRKLCIQRAGGSDFEALGPMAMAMYKVTADQMALAQEKLKDTPEKTRKGNLPLISFPWVLPVTLGKIATRHFDDSSHETSTFTSKANPQTSSHGAFSSLKTVHNFRDIGAHFNAPRNDNSAQPSVSGKIVDQNGNSISVGKDENNSNSNNITNDDAQEEDDEGNYSEDGEVDFDMGGPSDDAVDQLEALIGGS